MAKLNEILEEEGFISTECVNILKEKLSEDELKKDLGPEAASQVAQLVRRLDSLESQDTVLYHKLERLEEERSKIEKKENQILNSLHYQLKPVKVDADGKSKPKKGTSLSFGSFIQNLKLE